LSSFLRSAGFSPLAVALLHETTPADGLTGNLAARLKALPLTLTGTTGMARAISTAGGITRDALDDAYMLRAMPGVFAAGEMLDWEAP
ncbi:NAD(P)/FAD-dependent oxidoreductase, partial [Escherichia coli]|uniref:NAD(P)/FAD-dependent oxidoreductase n=1 Tax=Escherichia coli TaxID=562 RepID=UPI0028DF7C17